MKNKEKNTEDFFNQRATSYHKVSKWAINEVLNQKSDVMLENFYGEIAIEIGAGTGILISRLKNFENKIALDISHGMLKLIEDKNVEKIVGDAHNIIFKDNYADLILCRQVLHYCDMEIVLANIKRTLKKTGKLHIVQVIDFPNVPEYWDNEWAQFRKVSNRKHMRKHRLEKTLSSLNFFTDKYDSVVLKDSYTWEEFFIKHRIKLTEQDVVLKFFMDTSQEIKNAINLEIDENGISYDRLFGLWVLSH